MGRSGVILKTIGVPRATLIGQSLGAAVALNFGVHHPDIVVDGGSFRALNDPPRPAPDWHARQIANAWTLAKAAETHFGCARSRAPARLRSWRQDRGRIHLDEERRISETGDLQQR